MSGSSRTANDPVYGLWTDRYELAMAEAWWLDRAHAKKAVMDYFFRELPFNGGYAIFAGLDPLLDRLENFRFCQRELSFLSKNGFDSNFLDYLSGFSFQGNILGMNEGEVIFPNEPVLRVEGNLLETQIIETLLLNTLNFQTLVATKASRCRNVAGDRGMSEFGFRRAQGEGAFAAARAAIIGGFNSTSNLEASYRYDLPAKGTMAHAFVQSYPDELSAFRAFAGTHGNQTVLLLDTYDTLLSGLPNAITVAKEMEAEGNRPAGVRLDSGDLAYLSRVVREKLDQYGFQDIKILVSNQLDEHVIKSLNDQKAPIDLFGIGTSIATGSPDAALDGVYKLALLENQPTMKHSDTLSKATLPGRKQVYRFRDETKQFFADAICLDHETYAPTHMIHPHEPYKTLRLERYQPEAMLQPLMSEGKRLFPAVEPRLIARDVQEKLAHVPHEHKRFEMPHTYKVGLSEQLWNQRDALLRHK